MIKNNFIVKKKEYFFLVIVMCLTFAIGLIFECIDDMNNFSTGLVLGGATMYCLFTGITHSEHFNRMITFGRTRNEYIFTVILNSIVKYILVEAVVGLCYGFNVLVKDNRIQVASEDVLKCAIAYVLIMSIMEIFIGTMVLRFSKKFMWVLWALWMLMCFMPSFVHNAMVKNPDSVLRRLGNYLANISFTQTKVIVTASVIGAVMLIFSVISLKKQDVTA